MKRYRVLRFQLDTRATLLGVEIEEEWEDRVKEQWRQKQAEVKARLLLEFREWAGEEKIKNYIALGPVPFSIVAFHNTFLADCRNAFVIGSYYPSLTGAAALGERILNHLMLRLRADFKASAEYKRVYSKDSFDNWGLAIDTLLSWNVLLPQVAEEYRKLEQVRNRSIHFRPETDQNDRDLALDALTLLQQIVSRQFAAFGTHPWFIPDVPGEAFIAKEWEQQPFI